MKRCLVALLSVLLCVGWAPVLHAAPAHASTALPNEVIVKLAPGAALSTLAQASGLNTLALNRVLRANNAGIAQMLNLGNSTYRLNYHSDATPEAFAAQLAAQPGVVYAEPNHILTLMQTPDDPMLERQWPLRNIHAAEAWDVTTGGDVTIAVLDTGMSLTHPDLRDKIVEGYDFYNRDNSPQDDEGHGTHTAGVAAASANNDVGIAGLCWGCKLLPVKVLGSRGQGSDATIAEGIRYAVDRGARIISMSLGGPDDTRVLREAVQYAVDRNVLIVAASGNNHTEGNEANYPAAYRDVLAVGATGGQDQVTSFSTTGDYVDIAAPGIAVWSTLWDPRNGDTYGSGSGTSDSAPHAAGVAGLMLTLRPDLNAGQMIEIMEAAADDVGAPGKDTDTGYGRLNAARAVQITSDPNVLNQSRIEGTIAGGAGATVSLNTGQQTQADNNGVYQFAGLPQGTYTITVQFTNGSTAEQQAYVTGTVISVATVNFGTGGTPAPQPNPAPGNPAPAPGAPAPGDAGAAFAPAAPSNAAGTVYFPQTQHNMGEPFRTYWANNGALPVFGYAISEAFSEQNEDGNYYTVQYFERHRLEYHPENPAPYRVQLARIGNDILLSQGRDWFTFAKGQQQPNCRFFAETGHSLCGDFLQYWQTHGLQLDGRAGVTTAESLALFGQPLSEPQEETLSDGNVYTVQWFERGRFENHGGNVVLLGLLGNEIASARGLR